MDVCSILRPFSNAAEFVERIIFLPFRPFFWFLDAVFWATDRTLKAIAEENRDPRVQKELKWMREWWEDDPLSSPRHSTLPGNICCPDP